MPPKKNKKAKKEKEEKKEEPEINIISDDDEEDNSNNTTADEQEQNHPQEDAAAPPESSSSTMVVNNDNNQKQPEQQDVQEQPEEQVVVEETTAAATTIAPANLASPEEDEDLDLNFEYDEDDDNNFVTDNNAQQDDNDDAAQNNDDDGQQRNPLQQVGAANFAVFDNSQVSSSDSASQQQQQAQHLRRRRGGGITMLGNEDEDSASPITAGDADASGTTIRSAGDNNDNEDAANNTIKEAPATAAAATSEDVYARLNEVNAIANKTGFDEELQEKNHASVNLMFVTNCELNDQIPYEKLFNRKRRFHEAVCNLMRCLIDITKHFPKLLQGGGTEIPVAAVSRSVNFLGCDLVGIAALAKRFGLLKMTGDIIKTDLDNSPGTLALTMNGRRFSFTSNSLPLVPRVFYKRINDVAHIEDILRTGVNTFDPRKKTAAVVVFELNAAEKALAALVKKIIKKCSEDGERYSYVKLFEQFSAHVKKKSKDPAAEAPKQANFNVAMAKLQRAGEVTVIGPIGDNSSLVRIGRRPREAETVYTRADEDGVNTASHNISSLNPKSFLAAATDMQRGIPLIQEAAALTQFDPETDKEVIQFMTNSGPRAEMKYAFHDREFWNKQNEIPGGIYHFVVFDLDLAISPIILIQRQSYDVRIGDWMMLEFRDTQFPTYRKKKNKKSGDDDASKTTKDDDNNDDEAKKDIADADNEDLEIDPVQYCLPVVLYGTCHFVSKKEQQKQKRQQETNNLGNEAGEGEDGAAAAEDDDNDNDQVLEPSNAQKGGFKLISAVWSKYADRMKRLLYIEKDENGNDIKLINETANFKLTHRAERAEFSVGLEIFRRCHSDFANHAERLTREFKVPFEVRRVNSSYDHRHMFICFTRHDNVHEIRSAERVGRAFLMDLPKAIRDRVNFEDIKIFMLDSTQTGRPHRFGNFSQPPVTVDSLPISLKLILQQKYSSNEDIGEAAAAAAANSNHHQTGNNDSFSGKTTAHPQFAPPAAWGGSAAATTAPVPAPAEISVPRGQAPPPSSIINSQSASRRHQTDFGNRPNTRDLDNDCRRGENTFGIIRLAPQHFEFHWKAKAHFAIDDLVIVGHGDRGADMGRCVALGIYHDETKEVRRFIQNAARTPMPLTQYTSEPRSSILRIANEAECDHYFTGAADKEKELLAFAREKMEQLRLPYNISAAHIQKDKECLFCYIDTSRGPTKRNGPLMRPFEQALFKRYKHLIRTIDIQQEVTPLKFAPGVHIEMVHISSSSTGGGAVSGGPLPPPQIYDPNLNNNAAGGPQQGMMMMMPPHQQQQQQPHHHQYNMAPPPQQLPSSSSFPPTTVAPPSRPIGPHVLLVPPPMFIVLEDPQNPQSSRRTVFQRPINAGLMLAPPPLQFARRY